MNNLTPEKVKGRIKSISNKNGADPRVILRSYMMERFLERLSVSRYKDNFVLKGGFLIMSLIGIKMRSTMDLDAEIKGIDLSLESAEKIVEEIAKIDLDDGITFVIKDTNRIMENLEYPGVRVTMDAYMGKLSSPLKIDIGTGAIITPKEVEYKYKLLIEEREIKLWSYNLETILAEKFESVFSKGVLNTRMRDYYDIYELVLIFNENINYDILKCAFKKTSENRGSFYTVEKLKDILVEIKRNDEIHNLWKKYQEKFDYARNLELDQIISIIEGLTFKLA